MIGQSDGNSAGIAASAALLALLNHLIDRDFLSPGDAKTILEEALADIERAGPLRNATKASEIIKTEFLPRFSAQDQD
jgi:hypothetical protein